VDYDGPLMPEPLDPHDQSEWAYGMGKREAEEVLVAAWKTRQFPATRLRIPMVNGERDHFRRIESYLWRILDGGPVLLPDGGSHRVRHVYGADVARAIASILARSSTFGQAYNFCQVDTPTLHELVRQMAELLGAPDRLLAVPSDQLRAAGLVPEAISPFSGQWMSFLDPGKALAEWKIHPESVATYLPKIVASFLACAPKSPPDNYQTRAAELSLASACLGK
jgi:nucleoside-diphosphate-sugar epimerase